MSKTINFCWIRRKISAVVRKYLQMKESLETMTPDYLQIKILNLIRVKFYSSYILAISLSIVSMSSF